MALETLKDKTFPYVTVDDRTNTVSFQIQNGPIKENGVNGCQIDDLLRVATAIIGGLNAQFPCDENLKALHHLGAAQEALMLRKRNREKRGVEGFNKV